MTTRELRQGAKTLYMMLTERINRLHPVKKGCSYIDQSSAEPIEGLWRPWAQSTWLPLGMLVVPTAQVGCAHDTTNNTYSILNSKKIIYTKLKENKSLAKKRQKHTRNKKY